jgi:uncharacterized protein (UPF0261 family)
MSSVYVVGTFDTKGDELQYVAALIAAEGVPVTTVDVGTHGPSEQSEPSEPNEQNGPGEQSEPGEPSGAGAAGDVDVPAAKVAAYHPDGPAAVFTGDRGSAVAAMAVALEHFARARAGDIAAIIGLGGSGGTALITPAMRALPIGLPKVMVSTVASGDVAPYVGPSDIAMLYSVTDVAGLNRISRQVLGNAAHAVSGMAAHPVPPAPETRPALGLTMFGVTTPCVTRVSELLSDGYDCLVFHATGTGGQSMEKLVDDGLIAGVLDISTTEVCDLLMGGVMSAGEGRLDAIARTRVPYVGSCGALDRPARLRQRQRDRRRDGPRGPARRPAHPGAGRRQRHRPVHAHGPFPARTCRAGLRRGAELPDRRAHRRDVPGQPGRDRDGLWPRGGHDQGRPRTGPAHHAVRLLRR